MKPQRIAAGLLSLAVAGAGAGLALTGTDARLADEPLAEIPGSARAVSLACGPEPEATMGAEVVGLDEEASSHLTRTRVIADGGDAASIDGEPIDGTGLRTWYESGAFPGELSLETETEGARAAGTTQRYQETGELAGLTLIPCRPAATSNYLVGGSTLASTSSELVVTNTSATPAEVTVRVLTSVNADATRTLTVAAHSSESVLLESMILDERIALEVTSSGGRVAAHLTTHEVEGIDGRGIDTVVAGAEPATTLVVPGADLSGETGTTVLRVANPGEDDAHISVAAATSDGEQDVPGAGDVRVAPGTVIDLTMSGLDGDSSGLVVSSDQPVIAGARVDGDDDFAWLPSATESSSGIVSVPDVDSALTLYAAEATSAEVTFYDVDGEVLDTAHVTASPVGAVEAPEDTSFIAYDSQAPVAANVLATRTIGDITGIAGLPVTAPPPGSSGLSVDVAD